MDLFHRARPIHLTPFLCLSFCLTTLVTPLTADKGDNPSAYEVLEEYGFPVGLLPKGVTSYDLNKTNGQFSVYLNGSCSFSVEGSYQLKYKSTIKGRLAKNKLTKLQGVSVKLFLFWINIVEVIRSEDELEFFVGIASANFALDNFVESPQCGCGFDCVNEQVRKIETIPFVSSS